MSTFEVTPNSKHPFLGKLKVNSKSVSLTNSSNLPKIINLSTRWEVEKQMMSDIKFSHTGQKPNLQQLRFIIQKVACQISCAEQNISHATGEVLIGILNDRISSFLSQAQRKEQLTEHQDQEDFYRGVFLNMDEFSCQSCCELFHNPLTLSCGHSFCQACILQGSMKACIICSKELKDTSIGKYRKIIQIWYADEWKGRALVAEGLAKFKRKEYEEAAKKFTAALEIIPNSHIAALHRAKAFYILNELDKALEDSIRANLLAHKWPEAYYVKGEILFKLQCFEEALLSLLLCLVLDPQNPSAKKRIHEILIKLVSSAYDDLNSEANSNEQQQSSSSQNKRMRTIADNSLRERLDAATSEKSQPETSDSAAVTAGDESSKTKNKSDSNSVTESESETNEVKHGSMALCRTRVLLTFELSFSKGHNEIPFGDGFRLFPSIASDLESELDTALHEIDNSVTRDLHMLQNSTFDKELMELLNIKFPRKPRVVEQKLIDASDFECSLCMRLLHDPVCTPCGHVFCQLCIERCLDHNTMCPLCKHPMQDFLAENLQKQHPTSDYATKSIIKQYLPEPYKERVKQHQDELNEIQEREPIFVCTIAFPSVPCPLHVFEPRYRLMLRRCLDHNEREFGMCMPDKEKTHHLVGTLLKVRDVRFFPDGRSVVDSIGSRRFLTSNCQVKDGYNVAKISYIVDKPVTDFETLDKVINRVYAEAQLWFSRLEAPVKHQIVSHYGSFPVKDSKIDSENGPDWVWWVLAILPVEDRVKASILGKNVLSERLLIIHRIFTCLKARKKN